MNSTDKKDLSVVLEILEHHDTRQKEMRDDIKFIKENLFDPHDGLWAETKQNTQFRQTTTKWRSVVGVSVLGLLISRAWEFITNG